MESFGSYFYLDGNILPTGNDDLTVSGEIAFYEVIRTRDGVPLFFDDHMQRLNNGISTRYKLADDISMKVSEGFDVLVRKEFFSEINVRVTVTFIGQAYSLRLCYIPSSYPAGEMISDGVRLILHHAERVDPGVKWLNNKLRFSVNEELASRGAYEALLVNREGHITEGSRSNVFFISDTGSIHTAPDSMVLSGITRKYVTEIIRSQGIPIIYEAVSEADLSHFRSAFITGTSPMVLPVRSIEEMAFEGHDPVIMTLRRIYEEIAAESIRNYKLNKKED